MGNSIDTKQSAENASLCPVPSMIASLVSSHFHDLQNIASCAYVDDGSSYFLSFNQCGSRWAYIHDFPVSRRSRAWYVSVRTLQFQPILPSINWIFCFRVSNARLRSCLLCFVVPSVGLFDTDDINGYSIQSLSRGSGNSCVLLLRTCFSPDIPDPPLCPTLQIWVSLVSSSPPVNLLRASCSMWAAQLVACWQTSIQLGIDFTLRLPRLSSTKSDSHGDRWSCLIPTSRIAIQLCITNADARHCNGVIEKPFRLTFLYLDGNFIHRNEMESFKETEHTHWALFPRNNLNPYLKLVRNENFHRLWGADTCTLKCQCLTGLERCKVLWYGR